MSEKYASVLLDDFFHQPLDYLIPEQFLGQIRKGMRLKVPLKNQIREGIVLDLKRESAFAKLKPIAALLPSPPLPEDLFELAFWMGKYYASPLHKVFRLMLPAPVREGTQKKSLVFLTLNHSKKEVLKLISELLAKHPLQAQILELFLKAKKGLFLNELNKITSKSAVETLIKKKVLRAQKVFASEEELLLNFSYLPSLPKKLTEEQAQALKTIRLSLEKKIFQVHLIHGITGSGKTEIYLQAIQKALEKDQSALLLLPEIALTTQTIERFKARFKEKLAILHHKRSAGERHLAWQELVSGKTRIALGARSAIFAPLKNLGVIIVDEEHDASYKNAEEEPAYHARSLAIMRGKLNSCPVILGSATPSLESYFNAQTGKYRLSILSQRAEKAQLPHVEIIDLKAPQNRIRGQVPFSEKLLGKIKERFEKGEQTLLFLNRRGYHTILLCPECSATVKCPKCEKTLAFHKKEDKLVCHLCNFETRPPAACPSCHAGSPLKYKGFGTEHVEAALKAIFPHLRTLRIDRDTTASKNSHETLFKEFRSGKADVLIGTQMIVKGLHFPAVTLVGVLNSDSALNIPDFRSGENVFQLICQVAGRSGRGELEGEVIIQTYNPENEIIQLAARQDYPAFYKTELLSRQFFQYPPFSSLIKLNFSSENELLARKTAEKFRQNLIEKISQADKLHPVTGSGNLKAHGKYHYFFLLRGPKILPLSLAVLKLKTTFELPKAVQLFVDVDPLSTYF
ncbi:MAG: primosomal protein N' [Parachlamydiales bacterium]|jgi:primosomal protein N' (replication factor Y)